MGAPVDLTNKRFGRLTAIKLTGESRWRSREWLCVCECGKEHKVVAMTLNAGLVRSCGCLGSDTAAITSRRHGSYGSPAYKTWDSMIQRCTNPNNRAWLDYGGRGIAVCERWLKFENFLADMGERPQGKTLDRYPDNDGNYEFGNCRWGTNQEQRMNQRRGTISFDQADAIRRVRAETGWGAKRIATHLGVGQGAVSAVIYLGTMRRPSQP